MQMAGAMVVAAPSTKGEKPEREAIHSGHFMVSHFEAEEQDDEDELAVPIPEEVPDEVKPEPEKVVDNPNMGLLVRPQLGIDTTFSKLFQCMSLAYRQKLTSPKWNRFRGIRLRWKDKIRLNNVIWRCWHMQFIKKENTLICQFASPLDVDTHNKPEAVVLEGKYWKRKLAAVTAEYKKWRMFYRNQQFGHNKDSMDMLAEMDLMSWHTMSNNEDNLHMMVDEDYMGLMSDTLFSTITNQPFVFPDTREIARAGLADFIQPSLGPLQPNLDDYMDTLEPFHDLISEKLPTVPEEQTSVAGYKDGWYVDLGLMHPSANMQLMQAQNNVLSTYQMEVPLEKATLTDTRIQQYNPSVAYGSNQLYTPPAMISKEAPKNNSSMQSPFGYIVNNVGGGGLGDTNQKIDSAPSNMNNYAISQQQQQQLPINQGYKFVTPVTPNIKFTSQLTNNVKTIGSISDDKLTTKTKPASTRGRPRSRSNTREPLKKPPLISAISDPSLVNSSNSALLTQLLTSKSTLRDHSSTTMENASFMTRKLDEVKRLEPVPIRPKTEQVFITPLNIISLPNEQKDPLMLNSMSSSNSPILDSQCLNSPTSSQGSMGSPTRDSPRDHRRAGHIHAEQKRRYNIKNGFDMIHSLIPHLKQNPNAKLSKAAMLQKGAEYIKQLRSERNLLKDEMDNLRQQIETLNTSISNCQSLLPATGAPVSRRRDNKMQEMFDDYVRERTLKDWKFWIFSIIFRPLLTSFNNFVSTSSIEDLYHSTLLWVEQHCTLVELRPVVLNSLRYLCTKTEILSDPDRLSEEARQIVLSGSTSQGPDGQM